MHYTDLMVSTRPLVYLPLGDRRGTNGNYRSRGILGTQGFDDSGSPPAQRGTLGVEMGSSTSWPSPGNNADRVRVAHDDSMNVSTFTVGTWMRRSTLGGGDYIATRDGSSGVTRFWQWNFSGADNFPNLLRLAGSNVAATTAIADTTRVHHAVCVVDGTSVTHYVDGAPAGSGTLSGSITTTGSCAFTAGNLITNSATHFTGELAHMAYWARALTAGEITRLYRAGRNGDSIARY